MSNPVSTNNTPAAELTDSDAHPRLLGVDKQKLHQFYLRLIPALGAIVCILCIVRLDRTVLDVRYLLLATITLCFGSQLGMEFSKHRVQITVSDSYIFLSLLLYVVEPAFLLVAA